MVHFARNSNFKWIDFHFFAHLRKQVDKMIHQKNECPKSRQSYSSGHLNCSVIVHFHYLARAIVSCSRSSFSATQSNVIRCNVNSHRLANCNNFADRVYSAKTRATPGLVSLISFIQIICSKNVQFLARVHGHDGIRISLRHAQKNSKDTTLKEALVSIQLRGQEIVQVAEPNLALFLSLYCFRCEV